MCERCAVLEEEIAYLRGELALDIEASKVDRLHRCFRLTPNEAWLVTTLVAAKGRSLTTGRLLDTMPSPTSNEERSIKVLDTMICKIRDKIGRGTIETIWGGRRAATPLLIALIDAAMGADEALATAPARAA